MYVSLQKSYQDLTELKVKLEKVHNDKFIIKNQQSTKYENLQSELKTISDELNNERTNMKYETIKEKVSLEARRTRQEKVRSLKAKNSNLKKKEMIF